MLGRHLDSREKILSTPSPRRFGVSVSTPHEKFVRAQNIKHYHTNYSKEDEVVELARGCGSLPSFAMCSRAVRTLV